MGIFDKRILQSNNSHVFKNGDSLELFEHLVNTFVKNLFRLSVLAYYI